MNAFDQLLRQLGLFWQGMSGAQRVAFLSVLLITAGSFGLLAQFASQDEYGTLYTELDPKDASQITDQLSTQGVPYRLTQAGTTVQVPIDRIYDVRLELATQGLPASGPIGFETFDEGALGMTPFQQRVHFRRALEGELSRTIARLANVEWVRVHINLPDRTVFRRQTKPATAAVVMGLAPGRELAPGESTGITHLVSGAVEGLDAEQVTILDARGRMLAKPGSEDEDVLAAEVFDVQRSVESALARRAQTLLDAALGDGKSLVTVAAQINRSRFEERKERVNPDESVVLSEQRSEEARTQNQREVQGGVPGTAANVPGGEGAQTADGGSEETVTRETINFDVSRSTSQTVVPLGEVQKLSIAVIVDGTYEAAPVPADADADATEDEEAAPPAPEYKPRSEEELQQLREIVQRATGFDAQRGDEIVIQNLRFRPEIEDFSLEPPGFFERPELWMVLPSIVKAFALIGGLALLVLFVLRPALNQLATIQIETAAPAPGGELQATTDPAAELAIPVTKEQAAEVAEAMKQWLRE